MIVKNEEKLLPRVLASIADAVDEIVIVDTGSSDQTPEIIRKKGGKLIDFEWVDDFAAARNCAIDHSSMDWILWLDADEWIDQENLEKLKQLKTALSDEYDGLILPTHVLTREKQILTLKHPVRIFRRASEFRWKYPIMEVVTNLDSSSSRVKTVPITIQKQRDESAEELAAQRKRYLAILRENEEKFPSDPRFPFQIGVELHFLRDYKNAIPYLKKAIEQFLFQYSIDDLFNEELAPSRIKTLQKHFAAMPNGIRGMIQLALYLLIQSLFFTGNMIQSKQVLANSRILFPQNCQFIHFEAGICKHMGRAEKAKHLFEEMVAIAARATPEEIVILPSHARVIGLYNLAELEQSEPLWKEALKENPASVPALLGLGRYYIKNGKREEALAIIATLEKIADGDKAADQLRKAMS